MSISEISSSDEQIFEALDLATQDREKGLELIDKVLKKTPDNPLALKAKIKILTTLSEDKKSLPGCSKVEALIAPKPSTNIWMISTVQEERNTFILKMENGTVWKFKEDPGTVKYHTNYVPDGQGGIYPTRTPYHVPGRSSNNIKYFKDQDPIVPCSFEKGLLILRDINGENPVGCQLIGYDESKISTISHMDSKGYNIQMKNGAQWSFSWWQSWASWHWNF